MCTLISYGSAWEDRKFVAALFALLKAASAILFSPRSSHSIPNSFLACTQISFFKYVFLCWLSKTWQLYDSLGLVNIKFS